MDLYLIEGFL